MDDGMNVRPRMVPGVGRLPYPAYRGSEPYVFISYARLDAERVMAEIRRFNEAGYHVWYDEGIVAGNEWPDAIAEALSKAAVFVVFLTPTSAPRENVLNEIDYALNEQKPFLAIYLEETELRPGLKLRISRKQALPKYKMSDEEYEYKLIEAFTRFGLVRDAPQTPATPAPVLAGAHPFGDYIPKGTAYITDGLGREFAAIANSLVYKPTGEISFQTLHDLASLERSPNGYVLEDALGRETLLKTSPGDELWFLSTKAKTGLGILDPERLQFNMIKSIRVDTGETTGRRIDYCEVRMRDGSFKTPREFLFFAINDRDGAPPAMRLKKDLNKYSGKGYASLLMMKGLVVAKAEEVPDPYGARCVMDVEVRYPGDDSETLAIDDYVAIYAMGSGGEVHALRLGDIQEIKLP